MTTETLIDCPRCALCPTPARHTRLVYMPGSNTDSRDAHKLCPACGFETYDRLPEPQALDGESTLENRLSKYSGAPKRADYSRDADGRNSYRREYANWRNQALAAERKEDKDHLRETKPRLMPTGKAPPIGSQRRRRKGVRNITMMSNSKGTEKEATTPS